MILRCNLAIQDKVNFVCFVSHWMTHLLSFMNMQGNAFQSQLQAFTVLQPVVLKLYGAGLGPGLGQGAALYTPTGLNETITKGAFRTEKTISCTLLDSFMR